MNGHSMKVFVKSIGVLKIDSFYFYLNSKVQLWRKMRIWIVDILKSQLATGIFFLRGLKSWTLKLKLISCWKIMDIIYWMVVHIMYYSCYKVTVWYPGFATNPEILKALTPAVYVILLLSKMLGHKTRVSFLNIAFKE